MGRRRRPCLCRCQSSHVDLLPQQNSRGRTEEDDKRAAASSNVSRNTLCSLDTDVMTDDNSNHDSSSDSFEGYKLNSILRVVPLAPQQSDSPPPSPPPKLRRKRRRAKSSTAEAPPAKRLLPTALSPNTNGDASRSVEDAIQPDASDVSKPDDILADALIAEKGYWESLDYAVLRLKPEGIPLYGTAWLSVMSGAAYVYGASLFPNSPPILLQTPFEPLLVSPRLPDDEDTTKSLSRTFTDLPDVVAGAHPDASHHIATRTSLRPKYAQFVAEGTHILVTEVNATSTAPPLCSDLPHTHVQYYMRKNTMEYTEPINFLRVYAHATPRYIGVPDFILREHPRPPQRLMIVGAGNAGKSTLGRTIINHYLTKMRGDRTREPLIYVDVDVGVPDRMISGTVAAHVVTEPSLSRRSACRSVPLAARFFGDITPREDPALYMRCVSEVVARAWVRARAMGCSIVVNTHGWLTGLGESLLMDLCACAQPTVVAWVGGGSSERAVGMATEALQRVVDGVPKGVQVVRLEGRNTEMMFDRNLPSPAMERELTMCAYFAQAIASGRTVRVRVRDMRVVTVGTEIEGAEVPAQALVGATVALGGVADGCDGSAALTTDRVEVRGFGIVRAVDDCGDWLFVATPLEMEALRGCDVMVVGGGIQTADAVIVGCATMFHGRSTKKVAKPVPLWMPGGIETGAVMRYRVSTRKDGVRYG